MIRNVFLDLAYESPFIAVEKIIKDLGYDLDLFTQKQIDCIVQKIKKQAVKTQFEFFTAQVLL